MNIEFKGTPGPWHQECDEVCMAYGNSICVVMFEGSDEVSNANAQLLAAAPELLEAVFLLLADHEPLTGNPTRLELIEHWEYENGQGNGYAENTLFAIRAVQKALGERP